MKIIAFGHRKEVGKDTAARFLTTYLKTTYPHLSVKHVSFAKKLKDVSYALFSWAGLQRGIYYDTHYREKEITLPEVNATPRDIWIEIGNKMREVRPSVWIECALKGTAADIIIISDLRFVNEAFAIHKAGGLIARIDRPGIDQGTDPAEVDLSGWATWNYYIANDGTLQELNSKIEKIAEELVTECTSQKI